MDYERMLRAYMRHVLSEGGDTFVNDGIRKCAIDDLSTEEEAEMIRLDLEAFEEQRRLREPDPVRHYGSIMAALQEIGVIKKP